MTHEVPQEVNLGDEERKEFMLPGEVFLGNWPKGPIRRYSDLIFTTSRFMDAQVEAWMIEKARLQTADWALYQFGASGLFRWARYVPSFSRSGEFIEDRAGIVVMPKLIP